MNGHLGAATIADLGPGASREWLVADGLGGFAMGTVCGLRTRRYHGLLVTAVDGPANRMLGLVALDPVLVIGDRRVRLSTHEWHDGVLDPVGHTLLATFDLDDGVPRWRWQFGDVVLEREIAMQRGLPAVGVVHRLIRSPSPVQLELMPICTWRSVHGERHDAGAPGVTPTHDGFVFESSYRVIGPGWQPGGDWYLGVRTREEAERGLADQEDLWAAGRFSAELEPGRALEVTASSTSIDGATPAAVDIVDGARSRARMLQGRAGATDPATRQLVLAADMFVIATSSGPGVVAGYPWFGEWSRDTMTSYEGLFLATGRDDEGRDVLRRAAATLSEGMLANTADTGSLEYNTVDAALWFVHAVGRHLAATGDDDLAAELAPAIATVVDHHISGTRFGIGADADGLLRQGADGVALTWMDARVDGVPVTQRAGKAVEINALWIQVLLIERRLAHASRVTAPDRGGLLEVAQASFFRRFVRSDGRGLFDVVDGPTGDDAAVRPNQLLAVALPEGPFSRGDAPPTAPGIARSVVDVCGHALLTPIGLRSLDPTDPAFRGRHRGGPAQRDAAYHQGTVWPWLIGAYVDAAGRTGVPVDHLVDPLVAHLMEYGMGSVSETADGDAPHRATGAPFQAWSVAEVLRVVTR